MIKLLFRFLYFVLSWSIWSLIPIYFIVIGFNSLYRKTIIAKKKRKFLKKFVEKEEGVVRGRETKILQGDSPLYIEVSTVISRAFKFDPNMVAAVPDSLEERKRFVFNFVMTGLRHKIPVCVVTKDVDGDTQEDVRSAAVWYFSKHGEPIGYMIAMLFMFLRQLGLGKLRQLFRFLTVMKKYEDRKNEIMKDQEEKGYYFLEDMGCDPCCYGKGYGSNSIGIVLKVADEEKRSCFLDTANPRNHSFYVRHGFKKMDVMKIMEGEDQEFELTLFRRDPQEGGKKER